MMLKIVLCCLAALQFSKASLVVNLESYSSSVPTKINNVLDGSKLYLASSDSLDALGKITVSSNGQTKTLNQLLNDVDAKGYLNGFPVNSDLTIATTNSGQVTDLLNGYLFISSPDMVKDPNFLVYMLSGQGKTIERSNNLETTLVILNTRVEKSANDPDTKPYYSTTLEKINQSKSSVLYLYQGVPGDGYTDPTYQESYQKVMFQNPIELYPTGQPTREKVFFNTIEPIQYTLRTWYIRAVGGGISFDISQKWKDTKTIQTTNETTTGFIMSQHNTYSYNVMYKNTPGHDGISGYMVSTSDMASDMNVVLCNEINCEAHTFLKTQPVSADFFQYSRNDTTLKVNVAQIADFGNFYLQFYRIEGAASTGGVVSSTVAPVTSTNAPETTTKSVAGLSVIGALVVMIKSML
ncbi:hypothetical protein CAEBREN_18957 [Caenorhabditis brenneri]|uniref:CUB-like domain-containing protein n=1 Tax=Caenorhabditis brenneri TaxID=135651 RepID=G0M9I9_CAEBE|nr:hypothetical protein CAEBREN_18957 [Caenorhabditis brenneri]